MRISDWSSDVCSSDLLDPRDVERVELAREDRAIILPARRAERRFVDIGCHGRGDAASVDAAQHQTPLAGIALFELQAGYELGEVLEGHRLLLFERRAADHRDRLRHIDQRSEEHTSELQSLMRI